jgi:hypothetical protein
VIGVASLVTRVTLDADRQIESGNSITVYGIIFSNSTTLPAEIDILDGAGTKHITATVPPESSVVSEVVFIADSGLTIDSIGDANVVVTVFHNHGGS